MSVVTEITVMEMKSSAQSVPKSIAGAIAAHFRELKQNGGDIYAHRIAITAVGAGAVNQANKGYIIAKSFVSSLNLQLTLDIGFKDMKIDDEDRTALEFLIGAKFSN